jgi:VWFA-related protein
MKAMCIDLRRTQLFVLCFVLLLLCLPAFSQKAEVIQIGVAMPKTGQPGVSDGEIRDRLVKAMNQHRAGKNSKIVMQAVRLDALPGNAAVDEAREKNCQFVLYLHLKLLENSSKPDPNNLYIGGEIPVTRATVEYLLKRLSDEADATGTVNGDDATVQDAILRAAEKVNTSVAINLNDAGSFQAPKEGSAAEEAATGAKLNLQIFATASACNWLPANLAHADALRGACEFAITLPQKMPNFVCEQDTSRYLDGDHVPREMISAVLRYENGQESFGEVKINGRSVAENKIHSAGLWSTGQFGGDLRAIFDAGNNPQFSYAGEKQLEAHDAWVFTYRIAKQNDPLWVLQGDTSKLAPPYVGELWIDQKSGAVLRFQSAARDIPALFSMHSAEIVIDYGNVTFADGTAFVLPSDSTIVTTYQEDDPTRNVVQFRGCHKFRAKARILLNPSLAGNLTDGGGNSSDLNGELDRNNALYEILRQEAIREDDQRIAAEQAQELNLAAQRALQKLGEIEMAARENSLRQAASANVPQSAPANGIIPTIKVSVNLVPVSVVTRDTKGHAVGNLIKDNFRLFDERLPQAISRFSIESGETSQNPEKEPGTMASENPAGERAPVAAEHDVAYVFDDLHADLASLDGAKKAAAKHLAELRNGDRSAIFTTSGRVTVDFTTDQGQLQATVHGLMPNARGDAEGCPPMSYYEADLIVNREDASALGVATESALACMFPGAKNKPDPGELHIAERTVKAKAYELVANGKIESDATLRALKNAITRTAGMPGRRSLVLVSDGFLTLTADSQREAAALIENAVRADIVVNALDASGIPVNVAATANASSDIGDSLQLASDEAWARTNVMADLAYGTGGTFFHNNNDMNEGFRRTAETPEYIYVLGFSPQKLDGKFHKLKVALNTPQKLTVQARPGYYALKAQSQ